MEIALDLMIGFQLNSRINMVICEINVGLSLCEKDLVGNPPDFGQPCPNGF